MQARGKHEWSPPLWNIFLWNEALGIGCGDGELLLNPVVSLRALMGLNDSDQPHLGHPPTPALQEPI